MTYLWLDHLRKLIMIMLNFLLVLFLFHTYRIDSFSVIIQRLLLVESGGTLMLLFTPILYILILLLFSGETVAFYANYRGDVLLREGSRVNHAKQALKHIWVLSFLFAVEFSAISWLLVAGMSVQAFFGLFLFNICIGVSYLRIAISKGMTASIGVILGIASVLIIFGWQRLLPFKLPIEIIYGVGAILLSINVRQTMETWEGFYANSSEELS